MTHNSEQKTSVASTAKPDILFAAAPIVCLSALCLLAFLSIHSVEVSDPFFEIYKKLSATCLKVVLSISAILAGLLWLGSFQTMTIKTRIKSVAFALPFVIILLIAFALKISYLIIILLFLVLIYPMATYRA